MIDGKLYCLPVLCVCMHTVSEHNIMTYADKVLPSQVSACKLVFGDQCSSCEGWHLWTRTCVC